MSGQFVREVATALVMVGGAFFMFVTGLGLVRFPDVYTRMHAAGKAGTIGIALLILAPVFWFLPTEPFVSFRGVVAIFFQFLTSPGATYLLAHAAYARSYPQHHGTMLDEFGQWLPTVPDDVGNE